jgi:hypothetical protein
MAFKIGGLYVDIYNIKRYTIQWHAFDDCINSYGFALDF